jgi:hypothetical protein
MAADQALIPEGLTGLTMQPVVATGLGTSHKQLSLASMSHLRPEPTADCCCTCGTTWMLQASENHKQISARHHGMCQAHSSCDSSWRDHYSTQLIFKQQRCSTVSNCMPCRHIICLQMTRSSTQALTQCDKSFNVAAERHLSVNDSRMMG